MDCKPRLLRRLFSHRPYAGDFRIFRDIVPPHYIDKIIHCRGTCKGNDVDCISFRDLPKIFPFPAGGGSAIGSNHIADGAHPRQTPGNDISCNLRPGNENILPRYSDLLKGSHHRLGYVVLGDEVHTDSILFHRSGRRRADGAYTDPLEIPCVFSQVKEAVEEVTNAIYAGKYYPVVSFDMLYRPVQVVETVRRDDLYGGKGDNPGTLFIEEIGKLGRLRLRSGNDYSLSEEGFFLEPAQFFSQTGHIPHDKDGRRLEALFSGQSHDCAECSRQCLLTGSGSPSYEGHLCRGVPPLLHQVGNDCGEIFYPHKENDGSDGCNLFPVDITPLFCGIFMTRHKGGGGCNIPVCKRYPRIGRRCYS